jgi:hypothetical protein
LNQQLTSNSNQGDGKEDSSSKEGENPTEAYKVAKHKYQDICKARLGNLNEKYGEQWSSLFEQYGEKTLLGAFEIWARDQGRGKKLGYPIAVFLTSVDDYIAAFEDESAPGSDEPEEDRMLTGRDVIREREERERESRGR